MQYHATLWGTVYLEIFVLGNFRMINFFRVEIFL